MDIEYGTATFLTSIGPDVFDMRQEYTFMRRSSQFMLLTKDVLFTAFRKGSYMSRRPAFEIYYIGRLDLNMESIDEMYLTGVEETTEYADILLSRNIVELHNNYLFGNNEREDESLTEIWQLF